MFIDAVKTEVRVPVVENQKWAPIDIVMDSLNRGQMGDAEMLRYLYQGQIIFDHSDRQWYFFKGHAWEKDRTRQVIHLVSNQVAAQYLHTAAALKSIDSDESKIKELTVRAFSLRQKSRIEDVLALAATLPELAITGEEWHKDSLLLAVPNGVVDLHNGAEFREGKPEDFLRDCIPTEWKGLDEPAPRWEKFLLEIFNNDVELVQFVQRLFGYGLTGLATDDKFPILWGEGRNGKDTLLETIEAVLSNSIAAPVQSEVLVNTDKNANAATPHLVALRNRRIVWVNETNEGARINGGQVKLLTGGGTIAARPLYGQSIEFKPTHLIMLMTNHKPHTGDDDAIWKRILLIEFGQRFVDEPQAANEHPCDPMLSEKLKSEASGILAWLVRGAVAWQEKGLLPPKSVSDSTKEYRSKEDVLHQFLAECAVISPNYSDTFTNIYLVYREWSEESGFGKGMSKTALGERLGKRFQKIHTRTGYQYLGLKIADQ